jgi:hypothetical protein
MTVMTTRVVPAALRECPLDRECMEDRRSQGLDETRRML